MQGWPWIGDLVHELAVRPGRSWIVAMLHRAHFVLAAASYARQPGDNTMSAAHTRMHVNQQAWICLVVKTYDKDEKNAGGFNNDGTRWEGRARK